MSRINDYTYRFNSINELNSYTIGKYKEQANHFFTGINREGLKIFGIVFNSFEKVELDNGEIIYISIRNLKTNDNEKCAVLGPLNINKKTDQSVCCYTNGTHIFVVSSKYIKSIELGIVLVDKDINPDWINILYDLTS